MIHDFLPIKKPAFTGRFSLPGRRHQIKDIEIAIPRPFNSAEVLLNLLRYLSLISHGLSDRIYPLFPKSSIIIGLLIKLSNDSAMNGKLFILK